MAFSAPTSKNVLEILADLENSAFQHNRISNLPRKMNLGLKQTYAELLATKSFPISSNSKQFTRTFPTNELGHLLIGKSFPILAKRYRISEQIAEGTFSQIFRAVDVFHKKEVAVKVMRVGYEILGRKEFALLRHMATRTLQGNQYCK